ncbi:glycosyltransferase [Cellulosimicrobium cellulans]|uniref:glycosyltransferase n=1 Tax=Cellulosimicrobium cellulans TaxID=1710 RepID=UPI0009F2278D|nr:glycosyltransferase [Cellulosimicrobium cellulans]
MDVLVVSTWYPNEVAPVSGTFVEKDVHVLARDHSVEVVHLVSPHLHDGGPPTVLRDGVTVHRVVMSTQRPGDVVRARLELQPLLDRAELVHSMAFSTLLPLGLRRPSAPWVHTEHWSGLSNPTSLPIAWRTALPALRRLLARPDAVTAVCEYLARPVRAVRPGPTSVVPCLVPSPDVVPPRPPREDVLRLVAVGGLVERKGPDVAVEALAVLRDRGRLAELTWVGSGPLRDSVLARAERLEVADRVHLVGNLDAAGVSEALARADLFVLPTQAENFCVAAAEALVHGRPVVVGSNGGQGEYIDPRVGQLVRRHDPEAYADAVLGVDERTMDLPASSIAATVGDRFSARTLSEGYARAYEVARQDRLQRSSR